MTENLEKSAKVLATMLDYLGLRAEVSVKEIDGKTVLSTESDDAGRIIGKRGQTLQNLELLLNRIATKNDPECSWISINVDGYSSRGSRDNRFKRRNDQRDNDHRPQNRHERVDSERSFSSFRNREDRNRPHFNEENDESETLTKMALDSAKEVKRWGESVTLRAMNSHDRRVVHVALKDDPEIKTESIAVEGSETLKNIVISLNK
ncbi:MAG TPA: hypothetical protein DD381_01440 [Lentisphaeria bacterium]|nr:MAG: hypothetical protein A2X47_10590 [Lentisphaerae bacterium GWF2_38_69]HBM15008.1 hypothetical protein [Lentisphaeria bacterium]